MIGFALPVIVIAAIVGVAVWMQRSRSAGSPGADAGVTTDEAPPRRISLLTEAVGYIGTILVLAGAIAALGQRWSDIGTGGRLAILVIATLIFLGIGLFVRGSSEPAFKRLTGVTWAVSVGAFAGSAGVVCQSADASGRTAFLAIATSSALYAAVLWFLHRHAIQQAVLFLGVLLATASIINWTIDQVDPWMIVVPLWAVGLAWAAAGWWRRIDPWFVAVPLGLLVALLAPSSLGDANALRFGLGIGTAGLIMVLSVIVRFTPALAMASVAMLGYVIGAVTYYFGDTLGVPASLSIAGVLILALAAIATRWHWFSKTHPPTGEPPSSGSTTTSAPGEHRHAA